MKEHSEVLLEIFGGIVLTWAISFVIVYFCLSRFIHDTQDVD